MDLTKEICKTCGAPLDLNEASEGVVRCLFCGNSYTLPKRDVSPAALSFLRQGEHDLDTREFEKAYEAYSKAAQIDEDESEAYFGMALAEFKVQYLLATEQNTGNKCLQPICYEKCDEDFTLNKNYLKALQLATASQRTEYLRRGGDIDYIRREFKALEKSGLDYDCFICVKVSDGLGGKTEDSKDADYIYGLLKDNGYAPFYSERDIRNRTGADYEAMILYALHTAETMLVVCRDEQYLKTTWVKSEYQRFLKLVGDEEKESDSIAVVYSGLPIERLEGKRGKIQGIDFSRREADGKIIKFVEEHTPLARQRREKEAERKKEESEAQRRRLAEIEEKNEQLRREMEEKLNSAVFNSKPAIGGSDELAAYILRANTLLDNGDFAGAEKGFIRVAQVAPENGEAWWGLFLAENRVSSATELYPRIDKTFVENLDKNEAYNSALKYAIGFTRRSVYELRDKTDIIRRELEAERRERERKTEEEREERERRESADKFFNDGLVAFNEKNYEKAIVLFEKAKECGYLDGENYLGKTQIIIEEERIIAENRRILAETFNYEDRADGIIITGVKDKGVKKLVIPDGVKAISQRAFIGCEKLTEVIIPESVNHIGANAFSGCNRLTEIIIQENVDAIDKMAFNGCGSLQKIIIRGKIQSIEDGVFGFCHSLKEIEIPQGVARIGTEAFCGCYTLKNIVIPESVNRIGVNAFGGCSNLQNITILGDIKNISDSTFSNCSSLKEISIPHGVAKIGREAFYGCNSLKEISIPDGVTEIGDIAFYKCKSLEKIEIPDSVEHIGNRAFEYCSCLSDVKIGNGADVIGENVFKDCTSLKSVALGNQIRTVSDSAFEHCVSLTEINLSAVKYIHMMAFYSCKSLKNINLGKGIEVIGKFAFFDCSSLEAITIPNSVNIIGDLAFDGCVGLKQVTLPKTFKKEIKRIFPKEIIGLFGKCKFIYT